MNTIFKRGDRVRVTLEGEITRIMDIEPGSEEVELRVEHNGSASFVYTDMATVEKVEPKYEVFGPGDVVRVRGGKNVVAIGDGCHFDVSDPYARACESEACRFTSEFYERVPLG